jgi:hypothetical protein
MLDSSNAMETALRVLTALTQRARPDPEDVAELRRFAGDGDSTAVDELACDVIQKALRERSASRAKGNT